MCFLLDWQKDDPFTYGEVTVIVGFSRQQNAKKVEHCTIFYRRQTLLWLYKQPEGMAVDLHHDVNEGMMMLKAEVSPFQPGFGLTLKKSSRLCCRNLQR